MITRQAYTEPTVSHFSTYMNEAYESAPRWKRVLVKHAPHAIARRIRIWNRGDLDRAKEQDRAAERTAVPS